MKKHLTVIYCCVIGLLFAVTIGYFTFNLISEFNHGELRTQLRFEKLVTGVKQSAEKTSLNSKDFYNKVNALTEPKEDFMFLKITIDGKTFYSIPEDPSELESTIAYSKENDKMINFYTRVFTIKDTAFELNAGLYTLRPSVIYSHLRSAFLVILIATIITIIIIIYLNCVNKSSEQVIEEYHPDFEETEQQQVNYESDYEEPQDEVIEQEVEAEETVEENKEEPVEKEDELSRMSAEVFDNPVELPVSDSVPVEMKEKAPEGLFNPDTGLGWEQYLETRLNNELTRATSSEIDLSLFEIKLPNVSRTESIMKKVSLYLIDEFQFKDLLFEYKNDSVIAIKISMNIDEALNLSEKIEANINEILAEIDEKCFIGITSRTIRMIGAERLLKEADEAMAHAIEDKESNIIAFRADAVKYREYFEEK